MKLKEIVTATYSFEDIRTKNLLYVDKTEYFYRLVSGGEKTYFCARPRRFGKSLAIAILKAIFTGRKDLFEGLYIAGQEYDWETYPIVHIDFANFDVTSAEILYQNLHDKMKRIADDYGVEFSGGGIGGEFSSLIDALKRKTGKKVVILIDEYDKPLTENINDAEEVQKVRKVLNPIYSVIKGQNENERFVFITGTTTDKMGILLYTNNLVDITMKRDYACMFGYTQAELEANFAPYIDDYISKESMAGNNIKKDGFMAKIDKWYNGFKFDYQAETVYNPVAIGTFINSGCAFSSDFAAKELSGLLSRFAKKQRISKDILDFAMFDELSFASFEVEYFVKDTVSEGALVLLLYQTGFLTMDALQTWGRNRIYELRCPNYEIQRAFEMILQTS